MKRQEKKLHENQHLGVRPIKASREAEGFPDRSPSPPTDVAGLRRQRNCGA
jgi:hypothetical protein